MNRGRQIKNSLAIRNCSSQRASSESGDGKILLNSRRKKKKKPTFLSRVQLYWKKDPCI